MGKKFTDRLTDKQTNIITEKAKTIYPLYTSYRGYKSFVPNFRILTQVVAEKSLTDKNVYMYYIRVKEGKHEKLKKEDKLRISILISIYTVDFAFLKVNTKFENTGSNRS